MEGVQDESTEQSARTGAERGMESDMTWKIEPAGMEDLEAVYALTNELEGETLPFESFHEIYESMMGSEDEFILVARAETILGYVHGRFTRELHHGGTISTVQEMIVGKEYRNRHVGRELLGKAVRLSKERGAEAIELTSHLSRLPAHRFYEACGFERTSWKFVMELPGEEDVPEVRHGASG